MAWSPCGPCWFPSALPGCERSDWRFRSADLTGGATAVLFGWRGTTIDVDIRIVPESDRLLRAIPSLKESLRMNVELAWPLDFIPVPSGWEERSPFIAQERKLSFHHFDMYAQAMAKVERRHSQDLTDVAKMIELGSSMPPKHACSSSA